MNVITHYCTGLGFYLNGVLYPNNSIVNIEDIGVGTSALHCITDRRECCRNADGGASGEWYQPGQTNPVVRGGLISMKDFSRSRNSSAVSLHRRNNATSPAGLYRCEIPDAGGVYRHYTMLVEVNMFHGLSNIGSLMLAIKGR